MSPKAKPIEENVWHFLDILGQMITSGQGEDARVCVVLAYFRMLQERPLWFSAHPVMVWPFTSQEDALVRCSHTIAGQPLGSRPAQPPPHPDGIPEAYLTGPLINPKSLHSALWQSRTSTQRFLGSQHKGYPLWTECSLHFLPPVPQMKVRTWPLTG